MTHNNGNNMIQSYSRIFMIQLIMGNSKMNKKQAEELLKSGKTITIKMKKIVWKNNECLVY